MGHLKSAGMKPVLTRSSRVASIFGEILRRAGAARLCGQDPLGVLKNIHVVIVTIVILGLYYVHGIL